MQDFLRPLLLLSIVLMVPIIPLLVWGELFTHSLVVWQESPPGRGIIAMVIVAVLAADVFLPIPSGPVSTLAGAELGTVGGTLFCWLGMTSGAVLAYGLAWRWGRAVALRFSNEKDLARLESSAKVHDVWLLIITRPLPVFAEASLLLAGLLRIPWHRFLLTVAVSNLAIAGTYCMLGEYAAERAWLPGAVCLSLAVPVGLALVARRRWFCTHSLD
ncbi:MAG: VTT domain-containing protein [Pirellulales bacterium]|nr:VTT domain-containing protein [Pirellulales bacterium]